MNLFISIYEKKFQLNKFFLKSIFIISFITVAINFYKWLSRKSYLQYSDWLINYQGGLARRGFIGEVFFQIHNNLNLNLSYVVFFFVVLFYIIFFYLLYKKTTAIKLNFLNTLIIFSPLSFIYLAFHQTMAGRKEILFFSLIAIFFSYFNNLKFHQIKYWIISISIIAGLTHSGFLFYIPYLVLFFAFFYSTKTKLEIFFQIFPIGVFFVFIFGALIFSTTISKPDIKLICDSINLYVNKCPEETYLIFFTTYSNKETFFLVMESVLNFNYLIKYPIYFIISFAPLYVGFKNFKNLDKNFKIKKLIFYLIFCTFCTIPVFLLGEDYGRYIHWQYIIILFIYLHCLSSRKFFQNDKNYFFNKKIKKYILFIVLYFYSFFWSVPIYGPANIKILGVYKNLFSAFF